MFLKRIAYPDKKYISVRLLKNEWRKHAHFSNLGKTLKSVGSINSFFQRWDVSLPRIDHSVLFPTGVVGADNPFSHLNFTTFVGWQKANISLFGESDVSFKIKWHLALFDHVIILQLEGARAFTRGRIITFPGWDPNWVSHGFLKCHQIFRSFLNRQYYYIWEHASTLQ